MKKSFILSFIIFCAAQLGMAQTQQMWWGYSNSDEQRGSLGTGKPETFDVAIFVPTGQPMISNSTIKAMRIYLRSTENLSSLKLWISRQLPKGTAIPDYIQNVDISQLKGGDEDNRKLGTPNEIELTMPYEVGGDSVYVGYSFTVTDTTAHTGKYPIVTTPTGNDNSLWIRTSETVPSWANSLDRSKLALQLLIEGELRINYVTTADFVEQAVAVGQTVEVPVTIVNGGKEAVDSIAYTITTADGQTTDEVTLAISPALAYGMKTTVMIPVTGDAQPGITARTITVTRVNGTPNETLAQAQGTLRTVEEVKTFARTVLVEAFGTESTPNWPKATEGLFNMLKMYPELENRIAIVCHHAGYSEDSLTTEDDIAYEWLYGVGEYIYAPAYTWDRYVSPLTDANTPIMASPSTINGHKNRIEERLSQPSSADVQLTASLNEEKTQLTVEARCERTRNFASTPARLTLMLTEDNLPATNQAGIAEGETFIHRHTFRAANATWGEPLQWQDDQASLSCTFNLDPSWKLDDIRVVGFVAGYDPQDPTNCAVEQAAVCRLAGDDSGIHATFAGDVSMKKNLDVYDLQGRSVSKAQLRKGIYVTDGKKFVVK